MDDAPSCGCPARWPILAAVIVGLALRAYWAWMLPYNDAPDEYCHYAMVRYISDHHHWPTMKDVPEKVPVSYPALPALGYMPCVLTNLPIHETLHRWIPLLPAPPHNFEINFHRPRLGNVLVGGLTIWIAAMAGRRLAPTKPWIASTLGWCFALQPQLVFVNSYINNDTSMVLGCVCLTWLWLRIADEGLTTGSAVLLGLASAWTVQAKLNGVSAVIAGLPILLARRSFQARPGRVRRESGCVEKTPIADAPGSLYFVRQLLLAAAIFALAMLPWWLWSWRHHHSLTGAEIHRRWWFDYVQATGMPQGLLHWRIIPDFLYGSWQSFWGCFGYCSVFLNWFDYLSAALVVGIAAGQILRLTWQRWRNWPLNQRSIAALIACNILLTFAAHFLHSFKFGLSAQGRYLFPAIWSILVLLVIGMSEWLPGLWGRRFGIGILITLFLGLQAESIRWERKSNIVPQSNPAVTATLRSYVARLAVFEIPGTRRLGDCNNLVWRTHSVIVGKSQVRQVEGICQLDLECSSLDSADCILLDLEQRTGTIDQMAIELWNADASERIEHWDLTYSVPGVTHYRIDLRPLLARQVNVNRPLRLRLLGSRKPAEIGILQFDLIDTQGRIMPFNDRTGVESPDMQKE